MSAVIEHGPLVLFLLIISAGCIIASSYGQNLFPKIGRTRRLILSAFIVQIGGLLASVWTWMIHNQLAGAGSSGFCAAEGLIQCGSVIGDPYYSKDPILGIPWGIVGLLAFSVLGYFTVSPYMDMESDWSKKFIDYAYWISIPGIFGIVWLVIAELFLVQGAPHICPYCTSVHIALIANLVILHLIRSDKDAGIWEADGPKSVSEPAQKKKKKKKSKVESSKSKTDEAEKIVQDEIKSENEDLELTSSGIRAKTKKSDGKKKSGRSRKRSKRRKR